MINQDSSIKLIKDINDILSTREFHGFRASRKIAIEKIKKLEKVINLIEIKLNLEVSPISVDLRDDINEKEFIANGKFRERYNDIRRATTTFLKRDLHVINPETITKQANRLAMRTRFKIKNFLESWCKY